MAIARLSGWLLGDLVRPVPATAELGKHLSLAGSIGAIGSLFALLDPMGVAFAVAVSGAGFWLGARLYVLFSAKELEWKLVSERGARAVPPLKEG
ncbi:MAG: hypothetical protein JJU18_02590 [Oceanicaulis sp.]|nr:hypothetical protein [Oceanicaulis sp.]